VSDTSSKVLRSGCLGCVIGGAAAAVIGGVLGILLGIASGPSWLLGDTSGLLGMMFATIGFVPGAIIGALVGATRAGRTSSSDDEVERLKKRVAELEGKERTDAIKRKERS
jgi:hypothetical protein